MNKLSWYKVTSVPVMIPDDTWYDISDNQLESIFPYPHPKYFLSDNGVVMSFHNFSVFAIGQVNDCGVINKVLNSEEAQEILNSYEGTK